MTRDKYKIQIVNAEPLSDLADVIVKPVDGDYHYSATFMTPGAIIKDMDDEIKYGGQESYGLFFACPDLVIVREVSVDTIEKVIDCIFREDIQNWSLQRHRGIKLDTTEIYVRLLNEGTDCYRSVRAIEIEDDIFCILLPDDYDMEESWEFQPGVLVVCEDRTLSNGVVLLAVRKAV